MSNLETMIRDALDEEDRQILAGAGEPGFVWQALGLFSGPNAWVNWIVVAAQVVMFAGGVWCAWQFFAATDVLMAVKWGFSGTVLLLAATALKFSLMPVIEANRVLRELRRLELMLIARGK